MLQAIAGGHLGAMSAADLARTGASAATAQAEILGDRDIGAFFQSAQQIRGGFGNADSAMTALAMLTTTLATQREALTKQIGPVEAGTGVVELADRLAASVGGELSRLKGPFASIEIQRALAGITGEKGRATGAAVAPVFAAPIETLRADLAPVHDQQMGTTKAALEIAADRGARDAGGPLLDLWRPAVVALMRYQPQIHTGVAGVVALLAAAKLGSYGVQAGRWWRGQGGGGKGQGGGPAGGAPLSTVATMHVGTLVVRSMPGAGGGGRPGTPGTILSPNGQPAPRPTGGQAGAGRRGPTRAAGSSTLASTARRDGWSSRARIAVCGCGRSRPRCPCFPRWLAGDMGNVSRDPPRASPEVGVACWPARRGAALAGSTSRPARRRWRRHSLGASVADCSARGAQGSWLTPTTAPGPEGEGDVDRRAPGRRPGPRRPGARCRRLSSKAARGGAGAGGRGRRRRSRPRSTPGPRRPGARCRGLVRKRQGAEPGPEGERRRRRRAPGRRRGRGAQALGAVVGSKAARGGARRLLPLLTRRRGRRMITYDHSDHRSDRQHDQQL